jgi:hypothetical protein
LPAAPAITPLSGTIAVKTMPVPATPASGTVFGQVLQSVCGVASGAVAAGAALAPVSKDGVQGSPAPVNPDLDAAVVTEATQGATAADRPAVVGLAAVAGKPAHLGKDESRAAVTPAMVRGADSTAVVLGPHVVAAVVPSQVAVPQTATVRPAAGLPGAMPAAADRGQAIPAEEAVAAQVAVPQNAPIMPPAGAVMARVAASARPVAPAKGADIKGPTRGALATEATRAVPVEAPVDPALAVAAVALVHAIAPDRSQARAPNGLAEANVVGGERNAAPFALQQVAGPGGQAAFLAAGSGTPLLAAVSDASGHQVPPLPEVATDTPGAVASTPATDAAGLVALVPASDHKITLRVVEAGAGPAPAGAASAVSLEQMVPTGTAAVMSNTTPVAAAPAAHVASPAEQVAPALLMLAKTADGGQLMTVRLHPAELGMVQVRIAQAASGTTQIDITAENPATLLALQRDQPQLHRTLDEAGISAAGRTVSFHVAEAAQGSGSNASGSGHGSGQQGSASRNSAGTTDADGSAGGGRGSYRTREPYPAGRRPGAIPAPAGSSAVTASQSYRIGLDITA